MLFYRSNMAQNMDFIKNGGRMVCHNIFILMAGRIFDRIIYNKSGFNWGFRVICGIDHLKVVVSSVRSALSILNCSLSCQDIPDRMCKNDQKPPKLMLV